jgi:RNA polymerase sigma-70 factor (ECF subfamily)
LQEADAEDVTQGLLLALVGKMRTFRYDPAQRFRGWLHTLTEHALSDFWAHRRRACQGSGDPQVEELLHTVEARADLLTRLAGEFDRELLEEAYARVQIRVEPHTWEAFRLTAVEGLPGDVVARRLGLSVATVFKAKGRVLKMLREVTRKLEGPAPG